MEEFLKGDKLEVSLTVNQIELSMKWYCEALGFAVDNRYERDEKLVAVSLRAGAVRILLNQDDGAKGTDRIKGEGFSLYITTSQKAEVIAEHIKEYGTTLDTEPTMTPWGVKAFRVRDLDGFKITISSTDID